MNKQIREDLIKLCIIAEKNCDEFDFFKVDRYYSNVINYIQNLESQIKNLNEINHTKEILRDGI